MGEEESGTDNWCFPGRFSGTGAILYCREKMVPALRDLQGKEGGGVVEVRETPPGGRNLHRISPSDASCIKKTIAGKGPALGGGCGFSCGHTGQQYSTEGGDWGKEPEETCYARDDHRCKTNQMRGIVPKRWGGGGLAVERRAPRF